MEEIIASPHLLIVGGTGFIGHHLATAAVKEGWTVSSASLNQPSKDRLVDCVNYITVDLNDISSVKDKLNISFDYVVNLAGYIDHTHFIDGGRKVIDTHFNGLLNLIEVLPRNNLKRFVQIGSSDEYGNVNAPQHELLRESPISPYAFAKTAGTHFLQMLYLTEKFPVTIIRLFLTYGPGQDKMRFLPQIIKGCLEDASFPTSAGEQLRDFCFISDTVDAIMLLFKSDELKGRIVNIGSGQPVTIRSVIMRVCLLIGKGQPQFGLLPYRVEENMALYANISEISKTLGWSPKVSLETGLIQTINYIKNKYGY